jgi:hypothetical protein
MHDPMGMRLAALDLAAASNHSALVTAAARATRAAEHAGGLRTVVLVEGVSDRLAVEVLAERRGRDLEREGVAVVAMGGAQSIGAFLSLFGPQGFAVRLAGLCDAREERDFRRGLALAGMGHGLARADLESRGFFVCVEDLEDELIRSLGAETMASIIESEGELRAFQTFRKQPFHRGRSRQAQLRRFVGTKGGRKIRYAPLLVRALDLTQVPRPLDRLLAHV